MNTWNYLSKNLKVITPYIFLFVMLGAIGAGYTYMFSINSGSGNGLIKLLIITQFLTIATLIVGAVTYGLFHKSDNRYALGLPPGSIRAFIALLLISSFVVVSIFLFETTSTANIVKTIEEIPASKLDDMTKTISEKNIVEIEQITPTGQGEIFYNIKYLDPGSTEATDMAKQILTILATLVVAVSSFYFGSRATEQGGTFAKEVFTEIQNNNNQNESGQVPMEVIGAAVTENQEKWKSQYNVLKVQGGKKERNNVILDINAIIFFVKEIILLPNNLQNIPEIISYTYKGRQYDIPTDVRILTPSSIKDEFSVSNNYLMLSSEDKKHLIMDFITEKGESLMKEFPEITGLSFQQKQKKGQNTGQHCLVIQVERKTAIPIREIPFEFEFKGYKIPTDIQSHKETIATGIDLNYAVTRGIDMDFGMIGIPIIYNGVDYMLSCYHVLFGNELWNTEFEQVRNAKELFCKNLGSNDLIGKIGHTVEGLIDQWVDVGIFKIDETIKIEYKSRVAVKLKKAPGLEADHEGLPLNYYGEGSGKNVVGYIESIFSSQAVGYRTKDGWVKRMIHGLVQINGIAMGGDSGAPVFNANDELIGIIVGADDKSTYLLSAKMIESKTKYQIKYA